MIATAPGKLILTGEYAVLDGAPALVIAVDRRVIARRTGARNGSSPFLLAVADELARRGVGDGAAAALGIAVDSSAFYDGDAKLGLGSSAAVTVAATALALASSGSPVNRDEVLAIALAAHAAAQGTRGARGSGADIAAAVHGGAIVYRMQSERGSAPRIVDASTDEGARGVTLLDTLGGDPTAKVANDLVPKQCRIERRRWPVGVRLLPFFTGTSADTATLVARVSSARVAKRDAVEAALTAIASASSIICAALAANLTDDRHVIAGFKLAGIAVGQLEKATGVALVPPCVSKAALALASLGGTAKTTGAGGGDVGIAVIPATADVTQATSLLIQSGCQPLRLSLDETGVDTRPGSQ